ncbi:MAG: DUF6941 family protein [Planctomycetota bacterium]
MAPIILTLLMCEKVIVDARTQQYSLIGLVSNVNATRFPVRSPNLCIYTEVTGGHGVTPLTVRIVDVDEKRDPVVKLDLGCRGWCSRSPVITGSRQSPVALACWKNG